ncbi:hypothetical protein QTP70_033887, partial [Hemibagrus guttatus]
VHRTGQPPDPQHHSGNTSHRIERDNITVHGTRTLDGTHSVFFSIGFGLATILLSILGMYGAYQEHVGVLFLYSIFMTLEFIALLTLTVISMLIQPQREKIADETFKNMTSFYNTNEVFHRELNQLQQEAECCGLLDYYEFRQQIPPSCDCPQNYTDKEASCAQLKNCSLILLRHVKNALRIMYGTSFTLATIMARLLTRQTLAPPKKSGPAMGPGEELGT